jgi:glycosyltransferase involved in cell wall biosynthesis/peptidoglycan/xylan/chitin deacetylase (PgdA/CDA1 family)
MPLRIGILMDHPSPHMVALLDAIAKREDYTAIVIYFGKSASGRGWGTPTGKLPYRFLEGITVTEGFRINPDLLQVLRQMRVDVWVVNTVYSSPSTLFATWWLSHYSIPWVYMNEPPRPRNRMVSMLKSLLLQFVLQRAWGIIGMGEKAVAMYRTLLHEDRPLASIPYYIHLEDFFSLPITDELIDGDVLQFLTCCQMIHRKGLDVLFKACKELKDTNWRLTLVGDGPLRRKLEKEFIKHFSNKRINFTGEVSYEKRHLLFADKHVFILPSRWDGWGMVVPEALAAGLPVISTDQVVSAHEFIRNGENGFIIPSKDPPSMSNKMNWFIQNRESIKKMGLAARQSLKEYCPELGAERLIQFLSKLVINQQNLSHKIKDLTKDNLTRKQLTTPLVWHCRWKNNLRSLTKNVIINVASVAKPRKKPNGNRILVYHLILKEERQKFEDHLKFLKDNFIVCSVAEVFHAGRDPKNGNTPRVAITFDDGFRMLMGDDLELLEKFSVKACFYVPTGFVELYNRPDVAGHFSLRSHYYNLPLEPMGPEDLKLLVDLGHEVGSHGISHISLSTVTRKVAEKELNLSRRKIYEWTGKEPISFAYPYGETRSSLGQPPNWIRKAGYKFALTLRRGKINEFTDPFLMPRDHIEGNWSIRYLKYFLFS